MADLYLTPAERYTAALGGFYYGDLPEPGTVYTQLIKDILDGATPDKEPKNILARFIYSLYISDLGDPYPRYELAKLLYWKLHDITPTKSGSILTVTIDGKEDYMTINTDLSRLWYKVLFGSKTDVITEFPYIFNTRQNKLSDWELFGNTEVSGTLTPDNPIMPQGTGERTTNLCPDTPYKTGYSINANGVETNSPQFSIYCIPAEPETEYALSLKEPIGGTTVRVHAYKNGEWQAQLKTSPIQDLPLKFTTITNCDELRLSIVTIAVPMLNSGSTAASYEKYGYKIGILSASTTTPVYLGEVETTRKIKKVVLTGDENWINNSNNACCVMYLTDLGLFTSSNPLIICSHVLRAQNQAQLYNRLVDYGITFGGSTADRICFRNKDYEPVADFKSWLATQYAAGTPVCVWYVLATEETAVVNEPLMRIGDYADSISRSQTGIDIPTVVGQNTLDVLTTVKPSSMSIEYTSAEENQSRSKRISLLKSPLKKGLIK